MSEAQSYLTIFVVTFFLTHKQLLEERETVKSFKAL